MAKAGDATQICMAAKSKLTPEEFQRMDRETTEKGYRRLDADADLAKKDGRNGSRPGETLHLILPSGEGLIATILNDNGKIKLIVASTWSNAENLKGGESDLTETIQRYEQLTGRKPLSFRLAGEFGESQSAGKFFRITVVPVDEVGVQPKLDLPLPYETAPYVYEAGEKTEKGKVYGKKGTICQETKGQKNKPK